MRGTVCCSVERVRAIVLSDRGEFLFRCAKQKLVSIREADAGGLEGSLQVAPLCGGVSAGCVIR